MRKGWPTAFGTPTCSTISNVQPRVLMGAPPVPHQIVAGGMRPIPPPPPQPDRIEIKGEMMPIQRPAPKGHVKMGKIAAPRHE